MEAIAVKQFFDCLSEALSLEHPGAFFFSEALQKKLDDIVPKPAIGTQEHDISYLVYRLKQNVLGMPDPIDGVIRSKPDIIIPFACDLLAKRWDVIKNTSEDYTRCSVDKNHLALTFVKQLANFSLRLSAHEPQLKSSNQRLMKVFSTDGVKTEFNIYALLIPTLTQTIDPVSQDIISNTDLHRLILSDDEMSLFSLKNSQDSFDRGEGFFNLDVFPSRFFTSLEKERIKQKPRDLWPLAIVYTDFIVTKLYPAPAVNSTVEKVIRNMLDRAKAVEFNPELSFAGFQKKYNHENQSLTPQDIQCLTELHLAKHQDDCCLEPDIERLKLSFRDCLDTSGKAQSDDTLSYLALKARQAEIATITAEMLVYCDVLKQEQPDQHQRLMNQVLDDGITQPKTFSFLLKYVPNAIDCSSVALLSNLTKIFKSQQQQSIPVSRSIASAKCTAIPVASSKSSGVGGIFSFFSSAPTRSKHESVKLDPNSVANKMAYSPERDNEFI